MGREKDIFIHFVRWLYVFLKLCEVTGVFRNPFEKSQSIKLYLKNQIWTAASKYLY